jgi:type III secretion protein D
MTSLIIRLFSGKHYGAEIELTPGTWVFGSDDSCDIILSDPTLARRHAALTISENGATFTVTAAALDGKVETLEPDSPPASELTALTPYKMAAIVFAWTKAPASESDWDGVINALHIGRAPIEAAGAQVQAPAANPDETQSGEQPSGAPQEEATAGETAASPAVAPESSSEHNSSGSGASLMLTTGLAVAAAVLIAGLYGIFKVAAEPADGPQAAIRSALAHSGFTDLSVSVIDEDKDDRIDRFLISGSVANDEQRGQLIRLTKMLPHPTILQVSVDEDITNALKSGFNAQDIWPAVEIKKGKDGTKDRILAISGYIKNEQTESKAFEKALANTPKLLQLQNSTRLLRKIRYERDIQPLVRKSFAAPELATTRVSYLPGKLELQLQLTPEREKALAKAIQNLRRESDVPLIIDIKNVDEQTLAKATAAGSASAPAGSAPVLAAAKPLSAGPAFRVESTSLGALRFVKLSNGDRVFEGGRLPGGFTLERIHADKLILSRNGKKSVYPLRVKK